MTPREVDISFGVLPNFNDGRSHACGLVLRAASRYVLTRLTCVAAVAMSWRVPRWINARHEVMSG
jgi:hypothetical protein